MTHAVNIRIYVNMQKDACTSIAQALSMEPPKESFYEIKAQVIGVLANPKRLHILDLLSARDRTVSDLAEALDMAQATTSQHLAIMRKAGILEARRKGNFVYYRVSDPKIAEACAVMSRAVVDLLVSQQERLRPVLAVARKNGVHA